MGLHFSLLLDGRKMQAMSRRAQQGEGALGTQYLR